MQVIALSPNWNEKDQAPCIPYEYETAVMHSGGVPFVLPMTDSEAVARRALEAADALLLSGGVDIVPSLYGEETLPCCGIQYPQRDKLEEMLFHLALERRMPILAICRGMQMVNVCQGGTLYQDIAEQSGSTLTHPRHDAPRDCVHDVSIVPGTLLRQVLGVDTLPVNSRHHQAVWKLGKGLKVSAWAPDGIPEAMEFEDDYPMLCTQWHPENIEDKYPLHRRIFEWLMRACSQA